MQENLSNESAPDTAQATQDKPYRDYAIEVMSWVFGRFRTRYLSEFSLSIAGIDLEALKLDWARVLGDLRGEKKQAALLWALDNLPLKVPSAPAFKALVMGAPLWRDEAVLALPAPQSEPADPARVRAILAIAKPALSVPSCQPMAWAARLLERYARGERLTHFQVASLCGVYGRAAVEKSKAETA